VEDVFPGAVVQFEDFATGNALRLLARYRDRLPCFNDDIQGTAAVVLAALLSACRVTGQRLSHQRILFLGAGAAAAGIAHLVVRAMQGDGLTESEARGQVIMVDQRGLLTIDRPDLAEHQRPYAPRGPATPDLISAIERFRPTALIGVSTQGNAFQEPAIRVMARINSRPIIFPLSNPTSRSECTAQEAYAWSEGRALFASGSPFDPVAHEGVRLVPRQCNNAYVFPGVGLGVIAARARRVTDTMFSAAARALADQMDPDDLARGSLLPPLADIRRVSAAIAVAVAGVAHDEGLARATRPADLPQAITALMYQPRYPQWA
jgi:malate dehydrogenase (oxaloacetate-decarboxylating)(NADP+)